MTNEELDTKAKPISQLYIKNEVFMNEQTNTATPAAEPRKGFVFYLHWAECVDELRPAERATVYDAIVRYAQTGEVAELKGRCRTALRFILSDFERTDAKYQRTIERRREAGSKHKGNQYTRKMEQMEQNGTNGTIQVQEQAQEQAQEQEQVQEQVQEKLVRANGAASAATNEQRKIIFFESVKAYLNTYPADMLQNFFVFWSEPTPDGRRMRYELERTWSLPHRLRAWQSREPVRGRASPADAARQREAEAAERERQYRQRLAREEAERERRQAEQSRNTITYEEYLRRKASQNDK